MKPKQLLLGAALSFVSFGMLNGAAAETIVETEEEVARMWSDYNGNEAKLKAFREQDKQDYSPAARTDEKIRPKRNQLTATGMTYDVTVDADFDPPGLQATLDEMKAGMAQQMCGVSLIRWAFEHGSAPSAFLHYDTAGHQIGKRVFNCTIIAKESK